MKRVLGLNLVRFEGVVGCIKDCEYLVLKCEKEGYERVIYWENYNVGDIELLNEGDTIEIVCSLCYGFGTGEYNLVVDSYTIIEKGKSSRLIKDLINFIWDYDNECFWDFFIEKELLDCNMKVDWNKDYSKTIMKKLSCMNLKELTSWFWEIKERSYDFIENENEEIDFNYFMYMKCCDFEKSHKWTCGEGGFPKVSLDK